MKKWQVLPTIFVCVFSIFLFTAGEAQAAVIGVPPRLLPGTGLSNGLVGWWTFDGKDVPNGRANDLSGNANHGNLFNIATSTFYSEGKLGQGFRFDGSDDYVQIADATNLRFNGASEPFSISLWFKTRSISLAEAKAILYKGNNGDPENTNYAIALDTSNKVNFFWEYGSGSNDSLLTASTVSANKWYHVVVVWDGTLKNIYLNGAYSNSATPAGGPTNGSNRAISIGYNLAGTSPAGFAFPGSVDDLRIYNRALSTTEIQQLYNIGAAAKQAVSAPVTATTSCSTGVSCSLAGYWTFDGKDMSNGKTNDLSGNGNSGSLFSIATSTFYVPGKIGQAFNFDGLNDYVDVGNTSWISQSFSVSFWFKTAYKGASQVVLAKLAGASDWQFYARVNADGVIAFKLYGVTSSVDQREWGTTQTGFNDGKWHHVVITADNIDGNIVKTITMYVDGTVRTNSLINSFGSNTAYGVKSSTIKVGAYFTPSLGLPFRGAIDDVRIYNRVVTATDAFQLYNLGAATKQAVSAPVTATTSCSTSLSCGLIGYWTFDGRDTTWSSATAGTTVDKSGGGSTGTLTSMIRDWTPVPGSTGQGLQMDGTADYVEVADKSVYTFSTGDATDTPFTFSVWVKRRGANTVSDAFISKTTTSAGSTPFEYSWGISNSTGKISISLYDNNGSNQINKISDSSYDTDIGKWTHYAVTYTGSGINSGITLYRNGVAISATGGSSGTYVAMHNSAETLKFGARWISDATNKGFLKGAMDDVRIYNRALSATEILQLYNSTR